MSFCLKNPSTTLTTVTHKFTVSFLWKEHTQLARNILDYFEHGHPTASSPVPVQIAQRIVVEDHLPTAWKLIGHTLAF